MPDDPNEVVGAALANAISAVSVSTAGLANLLINKGVLTFEEVETYYRSISFDRLGELEQLYSNAARDTLLGLLRKPE